MLNPAPLGSAGRPGLLGPYTLRGWGLWGRGSQAARHILPLNAVGFFSCFAANEIRVSVLQVSQVMKAFVPNNYLFSSDKPRDSALGPHC